MRVFMQSYCACLEFEHEACQWQPKHDIQSCKIFQPCDTTRTSQKIDFVASFIHLSTTIILLITLALSDSQLHKHSSTHCCRYSGFLVGVRKLNWCTHHHRTRMDSIFLSFVTFHQVVLFGRIRGSAAAQRIATGGGLQSFITFHEILTHGSLGGSTAL